MLAFSPHAFASPLAPAGMFSGFDLIGLDGLIVLATLVIGVAVAISVLLGQDDARAADGMDAEALDSTASGSPAASPRRSFQSPLADIATKLRRPLWSAGAVAAGLGLLVYGQRLFADPDRPGGGMLFWLLGIALVVASGLAAGALLDRSEPSLSPLAKPDWLSWRVWGPGSVAVLSAVAVWRAQSHRAANQQHWDILVIWIVSMIAIVITAWRPDFDDVPARVRAWLTANRLDAGIVIALCAAAAIPSFYQLGTNPLVMGGDEGLFATSSRDVLRGVFRDPFATGPLGHPSLFYFLQAAVMRIAGDDVTGARAISALAAVVSVGLAYLLTKQITSSRWTGLAAAIFLGGFDAHIFWAHNTLNNSLSVTMTFLALLLVGRCVQGGSSGTFAFTGVVIGLAQYSYFGARVLPVAALIAIGYAAIRAAKSLESFLEIGVARVSWLAGGFAIAMLPLYVHFRQYPSDFNARFDSISVFRGDFLPNEAEILGTTQTGILWDQFVVVAMFPFRTEPRGPFFRGDIPFAGWTIALLAAVGLAAATALAWRRPWLGIVACYWGIVAGVAITIDPAQSNRLVMGTGLICIFAAVGMHLIATTLIRTLRVPRIAVVVAAAAVIAFNGASSLNSFFKDNNQIALYGDPNTQIADTMAREVLAIDPEATIYLLGAPRMYYGGFANVRFRLPDATGSDVLEPLTTRSEKLSLDGFTIFVAVPERADELRIVRRWYPGGTDIERRSDEVGELYSMYVVNPADQQQATAVAAATPAPVSTLEPIAAPTSTPTPLPTPTVRATVSPTGTAQVLLGEPLLVTQPASPVASPIASPTASPVASPIASPIASPVASPIASPIASPVASRVP